MLNYQRVNASNQSCNFGQGTAPPPWKASWNRGAVEDMVPVEDEKKIGESVNPIYKWLIFHGYVK
jgi:hypothetical protein